MCGTSFRLGTLSRWCGRRDSNPHNFRHWNLNPARLPIPPRPLIAPFPAAMPKHDLPKSAKRLSGGQSCSKLMESITFMIWIPHPNHKRDRCGGLITWHADPQQKNSHNSISGEPAATGHSERKMVRIDHGRSNFPADQTRTRGRIGLYSPWSGDRPRRGTPVADAAGQS
jgi:hypothetical protein